MTYLYTEIYILFLQTCTYIPKVTIHIYNIPKHAFLNRYIEDRTQTGRQIHLTIAHQCRCATMTFSPANKRRMPRHK